MLAKRTKTIETFIIPEEFDDYTKRGYVIFLSKPTVFGTYRAVKIEVIKEQVSGSTFNFKPAYQPKIKTSKSLLRFWDLIYTRA